MEIVVAASKMVILDGFSPPLPAAAWPARSRAVCCCTRTSVASLAPTAELEALNSWDRSHYVRGALMKHNTSGSEASMMHVT